MALLEVRLLPDPVLREIAQPVTEITPSVLSLLDDMLETMYKEVGIGLAAPQVGVSKRLIVMDIFAGRDDVPHQPIKMINPEIIAASQEMSFYDEGCLSIPQTNGEVQRPANVTVRYRDVDGQTREIEADGLLATCVQHENRSSRWQTLYRLSDTVKNAIFCCAVITGASRIRTIKMRVIFMGSPDFAVPALRALHAAGHEIVCVYSQPPRPQGRGHKLANTAVHDAALALGLQVRTPPSLKPTEEVAAFQALKADVAVVAAYGLILRKNILGAPKHGCINIHGSILPRWRGAAPVQRAIQAGDAETGVTIMQMDVGLDTGPMLLLEKMPILSDDTTQTVMDKMAALGASMIVHALAELQNNQFQPQVQPEDGVEYAHKIDKAESVIDWNQSAAQIERTLRAFTPWPGIWTVINGERVRLIAVEVVNETGTPDVSTPGIVIEAPLIIACGTGALRVTKIQRPGRNVQTIAEFLQGFPVSVGMSCTTPDA